MGGYDGIRAAWRVAAEARRAQAAAESNAKWLREHDRLTQLLAVATAAQSAGGERHDWLGLQLEPGEHEVLSLGDVELVETVSRMEGSRGRYVEFGLNTPIAIKFGTQRTGSAKQVEEIATVDTGRVIVTTVRVSFRSLRNPRFWELRDLAEVHIDEATSTIYFHRRTAGAAGGLHVAPHLLRTLKDHLEIAIACSRDAGPQLIRQLEESLCAHDARRPPSLSPPPPPPAVEPAPSAPALAQPPPVEATMRAAQTTRRHASTGLNMGRAWVASRPPRASDEIAGIGRRLGARGIDLVLYTLLLTGVSAPFTEPDPITGTATTSDLGMLAAFLSIIAAETIFGAVLSGSIGKRLLGLVVTDAATRRRPTLRRSFLRTAVTAALSITVLGAVFDVISAASNEERRSLSDRAARTSVVSSAARALRPA